MVSKGDLPFDSQLSQGGNMKSRTLTCVTAMIFAGFLFYAMVAARPVRATFPGTNGQIAFTQITADGPANVFIANPDGSNVKQVQLAGSSHAAD